ncbi:hypothetical protein RMT89_38865 [Streptomyces sp. P17]|nr:hypothetical protein [Streptomyces sp. P17]MDT9701670.1 hypothetical protein [Streptomyces sp. P17]
MALGRPQHGDSVARRAGRSLIQLTASARQEIAEQTRFAEELQQPVTTGRVIAVTSIRGGVGKSTVSALLSRTFNHYRHDPVLALEADAALGTLPVRLGADTVRWCCADLARILTPSMRLTDVTGYLVPVADGGWLLPAGQGRVGAPLDLRTYMTVTMALRRYFAVTVVDCETLPGEVARAAMDTAHAQVVVAPMTAEGVHGTRQVLDWLGQLPHSALDTTVVALSAASPDTTLDVKSAAAHLREPGVPVIPLPYDRHLAQGGPIHTAMLGQATRDAAVRLAAEAMQRAVRVRLPSRSSTGPRAPPARSPPPSRAPSRRPRTCTEADHRQLTGDQRTGVDKACQYLTTNADFVHYDLALAAGWPIASGVIEGAARHLIADRLDMTGSRWSVRGAEALLVLRAITSNGHFPEYWNFHVRAEQHRLHPPSTRPTSQAHSLIDNLTSAELHPSRNPCA